MNRAAAQLTYFHPTIEPQPTQNISTTVCNPVIIIRSSSSPMVTFTLLCNKMYNEHHENKYNLIHIEKKT